MHDSARATFEFTASHGPSPLDQLSPEDQMRLTEVLDQYLRGLENGLPADPARLIERNPDLAEPLAAYLEKLSRLHEMAVAFGQPTDSPVAETNAADVDQRRLGDFVLLGEVGRGGMGVVYEARQISLDRRVALKVLPFAAVLEAQQIARFKNEAQAAAQLHHPGIVPVFAVGVERGVHYYAMQFIDGQPLDRVIAALREQRSTLQEGSTACASTRVARENCTFLSGIWPRRREYIRAAIRVAIQAADALHAAHSDGIVHRDIKPSNLLVDADGKLWVTDFGLARCRSDAALTRSGDVVGTRQYMSPEQAQGRGALVDQRTDIYSLGATLYELLTLEPAIPRDDSAAGRRRIDDCAPKRPRLIEPLIPVDLETVVLKAMSHDRDERYLTAEELADDLRRVLDGKPTVARPPTRLDRCTRYAWRHRRIAAMVAVAGLLVAIGLGTSVVLIERQRQNAQQNYLRAERHFREAREAVDLFGSRLAERLAEIPGADGVRRELLDESLGYYQRFVDEARHDPGLRSDLAMTYSKIGTLSEQMGSLDEAIRAHEQAIALLGELVAQPGHDPEVQRRLAAAENNLALTLWRAGRADEASRHLREAIARQQWLADACPQVAQYRLDLALSHNSLGLVRKETGATADARHAFSEAIRLQEQAAKTDPSNPAVLRDLAASYNNFASLVRGSDPAQAIALHQKAADRQETAACSRPSDPKYRNQWALTLNNLGAAQAAHGDLASAVATYRRAIELEKELVRLAPLDRAFRADLAVSYNNLGLACTRLGQVDNAERSFRNALGLEQQLVTENPHDAELASSLGGVYNNLGIALEEYGRIDEAAESYAQAIKFQSAAHARRASSDRYRDFLSRHYYNHGRVLRRLSRGGEAAQAALARKQLWPQEPERLLSVAEELALASKSLAGAKRDGLSADECAKLAIDTLREAVGAGLKVPHDLDRQESFAALRGRADFAAIVHP